eukprot:scaffold257967_cov34-Attheya_sp.AAC.1
MWPRVKQPMDHVHPSSPGPSVKPPHHAEQHYVYAPITTAAFHKKYHTTINKKVRVTWNPKGIHSEIVMNMGPSMNMQQMDSSRTVHEI